jgi:flagellar basal-body rod protein FlgF/flagellar basal-body rod protein FlgG
MGSLDVENASLVGLSRQIALQRQLDVVANNIANINTTGYKADNTVFQEHLMPVARANAFRGNDRALSFVQDRATWLDLSQGPVEQTGNPLDVSLSGNAFLTVQTPRGERYTRNGALQINAQGQLVTSEGLPVIGQNGPIVFQPNDRNISINLDGTISVREGSNTTDSQRGKLRLASFDQPQLLEKDGTSTYAAPNGVAPTVPTTARVNQGTIEKSNVKSVVEMTRMIEITRAYTQIASMLQSHSDMRRSAIDKLSEVPA